MTAILIVVVGVPLSLFIVWLLVPESKPQYRCPVCLGKTLCSPYEGNELSYDICSQCGVEFGNDDDISLEDWNSRSRATALAKKHEELRNAWIAVGCPDWAEKRRQKDFKGGVAWLDNA